MKPVYLDNDAEYEYALRRKNTNTGALEAATGIGGLSCRLSATDGGAAINAALSVNATERGSLGIYYGVFQGTDLRTYLASFIGQTIYEVFLDAGNILISTPRLVVEHRRP